MANISFKFPHQVTDTEQRDWLETAIAKGKPGPEFQAIRAHVPGVMASFEKAR